MDAGRFDALARTLTTSGSRRRVLGGLLPGSLGFLGTRAEQAAAKKKKPCPPCKKRKQGKCKANLPDGSGCSGGTCQSGSCVAARGDPPSCTPQCAGKVCGPDGCGGVCGTCSVTGQVCTASGQCACPAGTPEICRGACVAACTAGDTVRNPENCHCCIPSGELSGGVAANCCSENQSNGVCLGHLRPARCTFHEQCRSNNCVNGQCEDCGRFVDYCGNGAPTCGTPSTGRCLKAVDGRTRCGVRAANVVCNGCSNDIDCLEELGQDSGAFCVVDTGPFCDCPDRETFCARPY